MQRIMILMLLTLCFTCNVYARVSCSREAIDKYGADLELIKLKACVSRGDAHAKAVASECYFLGIAGSPMEKNMPLSFKLAKEAVANGEVRAMFYLALHYQIGTAVSQDTDKATYYFKKCAVDENILKEKCKLSLVRLSRATAKPFGLEMQVASLIEVKNKFPEIERMEDVVSAISKGPIFTLDPKYIPMAGLKDKVVFIFGEDNTLDLIEMKFTKDKFDALRNTLKSKYTFDHDNCPMVGSKLMKTEMGNSFIMLDAEHLSSSILLSYQSMRYAIKKVNRNEARKLTELYRQKQNL